MRSRAAPVSSAGSAQRPAGSRWPGSAGPGGRHRFRRSAGAERAGGERVDGDRGAGQLDGQAAGELDHGALAGGVPGPGGRAAGQPGAHHVDRAWMPALVTSTSIRPQSAGTPSMRPATACSSVMSQAWPRTTRPVRAAGQRRRRRSGPRTGWPARRRAGLGQHGGNGQAEHSRAAGDRGQLVMTLLAAHFRHDRRAGPSGPHAPVTPQAARRQAPDRTAARPGPRRNRCRLSAMPGTQVPRKACELVTAERRMHDMSGYRVRRPRVSYSAPGCTSVRHARV